MLISLGQPRPSRRFPSPDLVLPDAGRESYLNTAVMLADLVAEYHRSAAQHDRIASVRLADGDIRPDQRFYDVEYGQAAKRLANLFPESTAQVWYQFLRDYMGYRLVAMPFCSYGEEPDPVTRQCVEERVIAPARDIAIPEPSEILHKEPEKGMVFDTAMILPVGIAIVGLIVLLGGRK